MTDLSKCFHHTSITRKMSSASMKWQSFKINSLINLKKISPVLCNLGMLSPPTGADQEHQKWCLQPLKGEYLDIVLLWPVKLGICQRERGARQYVWLAWEVSACFWIWLCRQVGKAREELLWISVREIPLLSLHGVLQYLSHFSCCLITWLLILSAVLVCFLFTIDWCLAN